MRLNKPFLPQVAFGHGLAWQEKIHQNNELQWDYTRLTGRQSETPKGDLLCPASYSSNPNLFDDTVLARHNCDSLWLVLNTPQDGEPSTSQGSRGPLPISGSSDHCEAPPSMGHTRDI